MANLVAGVAIGPGSAVSSQRELAESRVVLIRLVPFAVFITRGPLLWGAVLPLAGGLLIGSGLGPMIIRQLAPSLVRWLASAFGFMLAIYLWLRPT